MEEVVYQAGNTIRLHCTFRDFEGNLADPNIITIIFYDYRYKRIEEVALGIDNRVSEGVYHYDYTTPIQEKRIFYEWNGEVAGTPAIKRSGFRTVFI